MKLREQDVLLRRKLAGNAEARLALRRGGKAWVVDVCYGGRPLKSSDIVVVEAGRLPYGPRELYWKFVSTMRRYEIPVKKSLVLRAVNDMLNYATG